jgi:hypothetical protein
VIGMGEAEMDRARKCLLTLSNGKTLKGRIDEIHEFKTPHKFTKQYLVTVIDAREIDRKEDVNFRLVKRDMIEELHNEA